MAAIAGLGCVIGGGGSLVKDWIDAVDREKWDKPGCILCKATCYCAVGASVGVARGLWKLMGIPGVGVCHYFCKHKFCC